MLVPGLPPSRRQEDVHPARSVEPLQIWLTHVQRAFRKTAMSHLRPDCQPSGTGELLRGAAAH